MYRMIVCSTLVGLAGCSSMMSGQSWQMRSTSRSSPTEGSVYAKTVDNGNTRLKVRVKHANWPNQLDRDAHVFVVWARPASGSSHAQNLGAMRIDKDREGKLDVVTPLKDMQVFVTPEATSTVEHPTNDPVLIGHVRSP